MISKIVAVYPGRFQPFGQHHATAFKWLMDKFGRNNSYIVTSDVVDPSKSPFNFSEKKAIISSYGLGDRLVQVKNPYQALELMEKFNPDDTAVVFMVGAKDMKEDPRFAMKPKKDGSPSYFQEYAPNKGKLEGFRKHGYLIVAPHVAINVPGYGEMSGTAARKAIGNTDQTPQQKSELFKGIFGWEPNKNPKLSQMIFNKLESIKEARLFSKEWWSTALALNEVATMILPKKIINEGGAGGHMHHPFDVEWVKTGKDLVKVFQLSINYLKKGPASVKIDGINASIRLITLDGKKQFVMDRGSNKPLDVKGISKKELEDRFGEGHGMIKIGGTVLDVFNSAIPTCTSSLKKLGLWDNPNILFNIEYVAGSTNVLAYNKNFLAIHGLLEIEQVTPTRRATKEIAADPKAMQSMLDNLEPVASKHGYEVLGSIPTTLEGAPDLSAALNKSYTINMGAGNEVTKTLSQWLAKATVPNASIKTKSGKVVSALSKEVLTRILNKEPLDMWVSNPADYQSVINGFAIYMATMKLGDAVLEKLHSPLGPVSEHEGIVIRDPKISKDPFKITGKFILGGLASTFNK